MRAEERDAAYLWDMLDAARSVIRFTASKSMDEYQKDRVLQLAVERCVEIIGEAARQVSPSLKKAHPEIPWRLIIAQRNVLAHEYGEVKQDRMFSLARNHIPALASQLELLLPAPPPTDE